MGLYDDDPFASLMMSSDPTTSSDLTESKSAAKAADTEEVKEAIVDSSLQGSKIHADGANDAFAVVSSEEHMSKSDEAADKMSNDMNETASEVSKSPLNDTINDVEDKREEEQESVQNKKAEDEDPFASLGGGTNAYLSPLKTNVVQQDICWMVSRMRPLHHHIFKSHRKMRAQKDLGLDDFGVASAPADSKAPAADETKRRIWGWTILEGLPLLNRSQSASRDEDKGRIWGWTILEGLPLLSRSQSASSG